MNTKRFSLIACLVSLAAVCLGVYTLLAVQRQTQDVDGLRAAVEGIDINPQVPPFDLNALMRMQILQKVLDRQIIEDDYLNFIDDPQLKQDLEDYNKVITGSTESYHAHASNVFSDIFGLTDQDGQPISNSSMSAAQMMYVPQDIRTAISKTVHYAFYRDYLSLIRTDPDISALIYSQTSSEAQERIASIHDNHYGYTNTDNLYNRGVLETHLETMTDFETHLETMTDFYDFVDSITARLSQSLEVFPQTAPSSTKDAMRLKTLQKVLDRQIVETDYLAYIDDAQLVQDIVDYNTATSGYSAFMTDYAAESLIYLCNENGEEFYSDEITTPQEVLLIPQDLRLAIFKSAHFALYRNHVFLIHGDPEITIFIHSEVGGSAEAWIAFIDDELDLLEVATVTPIENVYDYYDLADSITARLSQF